MKISIITVVLNAERYIEECIESVNNQSYKDIEYIIIDGGSSDNTISIIKQFKASITYFVSEDDNGLYDAINKGIAVATGDIVGLLNADDIFASKFVLSEVISAFESDPDVGMIYGNLNYINPTSGKIVRKWTSKDVLAKDIKSGWMPAHPTLYLKRELFDRYGGYALDLGTAADYDLILRYFYKFKIKSLYVPILMVNMRTGGVSNSGVSSLISAFKNDYKALKRNKIPNPLWVIFAKKLSKLSQF